VVSFRKPGRLLLRWVDRQRDFVVNYPRRPDGHLAVSVLLNSGWNTSKRGRSFIDELERRGYDPKTLRFSIDTKAPTPTQPRERSRDEDDYTLHRLPR
jgi:hypothetical protein